MNHISQQYIDGLSLRTTESPASWIRRRQTKLAKQRGSSSGTLQALEVNSFIWCRFLRGWTNSKPQRRLAADINHCSPLSSGKDNTSGSRVNQVWQFGSKQRDTMFDLSGSGSDCSLPIEPQPADILTVFNKSHTWLVRPYRNLFIYSQRQKSINSQ